jgi:hypothetical protein
VQKRESRLRKARKVWELFLKERTIEQIANDVSIPEHEVMSIVSFSAPEMYNIDLSNTLLVKNEHLEEEVISLQKALDNSRNMGWIPISVGVFIAAAAIIVSLVIVSV